MKDRKLLDKVKKNPCICCGKTPTDPDHIRSVGAGGNDEEHNLWPLCRSHHIEKHALGLNEFVKRNPHLKQVLINKGWEVNTFLNKWAYYKYGKK